MEKHEEKWYKIVIESNINNIENLMKCKTN